MPHGNSLVKDYAGTLSFSADMRLAIACGIALTAWTYQAWLMNNGVLPAVGGIVASADKIQWTTRMLAGLLVLLVALRAPRLLRPRLVLVTALSCCAVALATLSFLPPAPPVIAAGLIARTVEALLGFYLIGIALSQITDVRVTAVSATCSVLLASCITSFGPAPAPHHAVSIDALLSLAILILTWRASKPLLENIAAGAGGPLNILGSKVSASSNRPIFTLMFIFAAAVGFGIKFGAVGFVPASSSGLSLGILACITVWFLFAPDCKGRQRVDALLTVSIALMAAGLLVARGTPPAVGRHGQRAAV